MRIDRWPLWVRRAVVVTAPISFPIIGAVWIVRGLAPFAGLAFEVIAAIVVDMWRVEA